MADTRNDDDLLEALFAAERATDPDPSDDFLARLHADADNAVPIPVVAPTPRPARAFGGLKGLFAASGLSGAAVLGVWIGFVMPDTLNAIAVLGDETVELYTFLPGADLTALSE